MIWWGVVLVRNCPGGGVVLVGICLGGELLRGGCPDMKKKILRNRSYNANIFKELNFGL